MAKDKLLADKSRRIAELVEEKNQRECMTEGERADQLMADLTREMLGAVGAMVPVRKAIDRIRALEHCPQPLYVAMQAALHQIMTEAEAIAAEYGISLDFGLPAGGFPDDLNPNAGEDFSDMPSREAMLAAG